jgi:sugar/nucleoside kinase (ribokinase family)
MGTGQIVVLGSIVRDEIHTHLGERVDSFGGITYNLVSLARLLPENRILPLSYIGKEDIRDYRHLLSGFPNVDLSGLVLQDEPTKRNVLHYSNAAHRTVENRGEDRPIPFDAMKPYLESDGFLVNVVRNGDLTYQDMKTLSYAFREPIFVDIHNLFRLSQDRGKPDPRYLSEWGRWVSLVDLLQMNELEVSRFTGFTLEAPEDYEKAAALLLSRGPRAVSITMAEKGVIHGYRSEEAGTVEFHPAPRVDIVDPTGCGDVYASSYLAKYLETRDPRESAVFANRKAAENATRRGLGI